MSSTTQSDLNPYRQLPSLDALLSQAELEGRHCPVWPQQRAGCRAQTAGTGSGRYRFRHAFPRPSRVADRPDR